MNNPYYQPQQQTVIVQQAPSNSLGVVGFCLMILGWITCGALCIPALIVCGIAMFKEPRGLAIAGFVLSIPGVIGGLILLGMLMATGAAVTDAVDHAATKGAEKRAMEKIERLNKPINPEPTQP